MASVDKTGSRKYWRATFYDAAGVRRQASTKCVDKRTAEAAARRFEREAQGAGDAAEDPTTLSDALGLLIDDREALAAVGKRSIETARMYRLKAGHLKRIFEVDRNGNEVPFRLAGLKAGHVDQFIAQRRREGAAENTIAKELVTLRASLKLAKRAGRYHGDIDAVMPVRFAPEYKPRERALTPAEFETLLANLTADHAARAAYAIATSANWGETARARRDDEMPFGVRVHGTKRTSRRRIVPIILPWQRRLLAYALEHGQGDGELLFASSYKSFDDALRAACADAKLVPCSSNDLRRTFAQWMRRDGVPLELIAPAMGHGSTQMLERVYGRMPPDVLAARMAAIAGTTEAQTHAPQTDSSDSADATSEGKSAKSGARGGTRTRTEFPQGDFKSTNELLPPPRKYKRNREYGMRPGTTEAQREASGGGVVIVMPRAKVGR